MNMTTTILREISFQLQSGNPLWGLALCNEYLTYNSLLRDAMIQRFRSRLGEHNTTTRVAKLLARGYRKGDLPGELQDAVGSRELRPRQPEVSTPPVCRERRTRLRASRRVRASATPRYATQTTAPSKALVSIARGHTGALRAPLPSITLCKVTKRS